MAVLVMCDHAIPMRQEEQHLAVPVVRAQRPAVVKHHWRRVFRPPVLIEKIGAIRCGDYSHDKFAFRLSLRKLHEWTAPWRLSREVSSLGSCRPSPNAFLSERSRSVVPTSRS